MSQAHNGYRFMNESVVLYQPAAYISLQCRSSVVGGNALIESPAFVFQKPLKAGRPASAQSFTSSQRSTFSIVMPMIWRSNLKDRFSRYSESNLTLSGISS